jgi:D-sedoheptulose 7-phosphate isomerase
MVTTTRRETVRDMLDQSAAAVAACSAVAEEIEAAAERLALAFATGNKVLLFGNGGSAAQASHFAAELVGRFLASASERGPRPAIALTSDATTLTAIANDYGYDEVFARQVRGLAQAGDVLVGISTSGSSRNVLRAFESAPPDVCKIALCGPSGTLAERADIALCVPFAGTAYIQSAHLAIVHAICAVLEDAFALDDLQA